MSNENTIRRKEALAIVEHLARHLKAITADILYEALKRNEFDEDERVRFTGALMRTAASRGWLVRTSFSVRSQKNHSNLLNVWASSIYRKTKDGRFISEEDVASEMEAWREFGIQPACEMVATWELLAKPNVSVRPYRSTGSGEKGPRKINQTHPIHFHPNT